MFRNQIVKDFWHEKRPVLLFILFIGWLNSICTFIIPLSLGAFFDIYYQTSTNRTRLLKLFGLELETLWQFFVFFFLIVGLKALLGFIEKNRIGLEAEKFTNSLSLKLFATQIGWQSETFNQKPYGNYILRYSGDLNSVRNLLVKGLHGGVKDLLFLFSGFGVLFLLNVELSAIILISVLLYWPVMSWLDRYQKPFITRKRDRKSLLLAFVTSSFSRHAELKALREEDEVIRQFNKRKKKLFNASRSYQKAESIRQVLAPAIGHLITGVLLVYIASSPNIRISGGELLVYLLVLAAIIPSLRRLFKVPGVVQRGMLSIRKIEVLLNKESSPGIRKAEGGWTVPAKPAPAAMADQVFPGKPSHP